VHNQFNKPNPSNLPHLDIRVQEACLKSVAKAQGRASINVQFDEKIENVLTEVLTPQ
jgi:hypothetical protein